MVSEAERSSMEALRDMLQRWLDHPELFPSEAFEGGVQAEAWQVDALRAYAVEDRIAIRSGHGVGKTTFVAWVILHFLLTRFPARIPCTAPSAHQLEDVLWAELAMWHRRLRPVLRGLIRIKAGAVEAAWGPGESFAVARTARREQPEAFQGFHNENLLFLVDEASGVPEEVFEIGQGSMSTPGAKAILTGNPTRLSGFFYNVFHPSAGMRRWHLIHVPCSRSGQVSEDYPAEIAAQYGEDSNMYRVRVLGEFPRQDEDTVIPLDLVLDAGRREIEAIEGPVVWGLDVARFGADRTALAKRMLNALLEPVQSWSGADLMQTAGRVVHEYERTPGFMRPREICVDAIGLGAGVADRLREEGLPAKAVQVSEKPGIMERYLRSRDELWFKAREWFDSREVTMPSDPTLEVELTTARYSFSSSGKLRVETKDEMRKRGVRSPDLADAFVLTFAASHRYQMFGSGVVRPYSERPGPTTQNTVSPHRWRAHGHRRRA